MPGVVELLLRRRHAVLARGRATARPAAGPWRLGEPARLDALDDRLLVAVCVEPEHDFAALPQHVVLQAAARLAGLGAVVSKGVDIPRLRVAVFATNTVTETFFRQAVGRVVRLRPGSLDGTAAVFIPDDPRLRQYAETIREQRDHVIEQDTEQLLAPTGDTGTDRTAGPFRPIAAEATDAGVIVGGTKGHRRRARPRYGAQGRCAERGGSADGHLALLLRGHDAQQQRPMAAPAVPAQARAIDAVPAFRWREQLRAVNNTAARRLAYPEVSEFAEVNRRLNAAIGITSIPRPRSSSSRTVSLPGLNVNVELSLREDTPGGTGRAVGLAPRARGSRRRAPRR